MGDHCTYVDTLGVSRPALVTATHGTVVPYCVNLLVVNDDPNQTDSYGRKIERFSSVVHRQNQQAHGNYWY